MNADLRGERGIRTRELKDGNRIARIEGLDVFAAGFIKRRFCFDGSSEAVLLHRHVILWETRSPPQRLRSVRGKQAELLFAVGRRF